MKKSFILHLDSLDIVDKLTVEMKANLFQAIIDYNRGKELNLDQFTDIIFTSFKNQFDRDNQKYDAVVERNKKNGEKGGRPITQQNPNNPVGFSRTQQNPQKADNDSESKNEKDSDNDNDSDSSSSPKLSSYKDLDYKESVSLFLTHKEYYYERMPTRINAEEYIVTLANNIATVRSDLIRVEYELYPYDTNQFLGTLKSKIEGSFNLLYQELKIIKDYSSSDNSENALKTDLFHVMNGLLNEYKFKGFNEIQHVFNSFKKRAAKELKVKTKSTSIKNYG